MSEPPEAGRSPDDTVFIVDDDEAVRSSLQMLMRSAGLPCAAFGSGEEFLEAYDGRPFGCVVLDVRMPSMSGFEVHQRLDAMGAAIPVIFLTAQGADTLSPQLSGAHHVQKPFRDRELLDRIRSAIDGSGDR